MNIKTTLQSAKTLATSKVGRQLLIAKKNSPTLMFGAGVVGMVGTTVLASRATLKLDGILEEAQTNLKKAESVKGMNRDDYTEVDYKKDCAVIYSKAVVQIAKQYAPAIALGALSIGLLTGSHVTLTRRNAGLTAAYATIDKAFDAYRERVREEFGSEKDDEFRYGHVNKEIVTETETGPQVHTEKRFDPTAISGYARFFDETNKNFVRNPAYNGVFLRCQQNWANDMLKARGHVFLNEVYDQLGLERSKAGAIVGWIHGGDGDNFIDFGIFDANNPGARSFVNGDEDAILLDFNVDGVIYDKI